MEGRLQGAAPTLKALKSVGAHLDSGTLRVALARTTGESWEE